MKKNAAKKTAKGKAPNKANSEKAPGNNVKMAANQVNKKNGNSKGRKKGKVTILPQLCKGCGICVEFCPTGTLGFKAGKSVVDTPDTCIACMFCELRCPDFAISVEEI